MLEYGMELKSWICRTIDIFTFNLFLYTNAIFQFTSINFKISYIISYLKHIINEESKCNMNIFSIKNLQTDPLFLPFIHNHTKE